MFKHLIVSSCHVQSDIYLWCNYMFRVIEKREKMNKDQLAKWLKKEGVDSGDIHFLESKLISLITYLMKIFWVLKYFLR